METQSKLEPALGAFVPLTVVDLDDAAPIAAMIDRLVHDSESSTLKGYLPPARRGSRLGAASE